MTTGHHDLTHRGVGQVAFQPGEHDGEQHDQHHHGHHRDHHPADGARRAGRGLGHACAPGRPDELREHDETLGGRQPRVARGQRQHGAAGAQRVVPDHPELGGLHHPLLDDLVDPLLVGAVDDVDRVARLQQVEVVEGRPVGGAVTRDGQVADLARGVAALVVAGPAPQVGHRGALDHEQRVVVDDPFAVPFEPQRGVGVAGGDGLGLGLGRPGVLGGQGVVGRPELELPLVEQLALGLVGAQVGEEQQVDEVEQDHHAGGDQGPAEPPDQPHAPPRTGRLAARRGGEQLLVGHGVLAPCQVPDRPMSLPR